MKFKNVSVHFGWPKPVVVLQYGKLQYEIGTLELKGVRVMELGNLDPEHVAKHHQMLLICEMSTAIRLAQTDIPEPVNTCSRKLFGETDTEHPKVIHKPNLSA